MNSEDEKQWYLLPCASPDSNARAQASERQLILTKPPGSLGVLEEIPLLFASWQGHAMPTLDRISIRVFAADHGVCVKGVSAFPQEVTAQMVVNFSRGGAAISVLSAEIGADLLIVNMGVVQPLPAMARVINVPLMAGTNDLSEHSAMTAETVQEAMSSGASFVDPDAQLCIGGEMGIGNTTSAAALIAWLLKRPVKDVVGRGTGLDDRALQHKAQVVEQALSLHRSRITGTVSALQHLGGLEIAGLVGYYLSAAQRGIPVLIDGFICTAAALLAVRINPSCRSWMLFAHQSAEKGHSLALAAMGACPLLDLSLRLGEGSGAAVVVPVLRSAIVLHHSMATFGEAGVSDA